MASSIDASTSGAGGVITTADNTGILQLKTAGTTAVTVDASQNVGIGTSSFAFSAAGRGDLEIVGSSTALVGLKGGSNQAYIYNDGTSIYVANNSASGNIVFQPANYAERMRIDSSGNVGIGTTPKSWGTLLPLQISNAAFAANGVIAYVLGNSYFNGSVWKRIASGYGTRIDSSADNGQILTWTSGTSTADSNITWTQGPYVANLGTSWTNSSDERLKNITGEITNAIDKVSQIRAAEFTWKSDESNKPQVGLIAQDLQKVLPEVVVVPEKEENEDGTKNYLGVNYDQVIPLLVAAIKEQQTIINDLKARVTALEAK